MEFPIKLHSTKKGWYIVYIEGSQVIISKYHISLKIDLVLKNSADPDEMAPYAAFHLGLHSIREFPVFKGLITRASKMVTCITLS